jgi:hypothetical protein
MLNNGTCMEEEELAMPVNVFLCIGCYEFNTVTLTGVLQNCRDNSLLIHVFVEENRKTNSI